MFKRKDLVVLIYSKNPCYPAIVLPDDPRVVDAEVTINEKWGIWTAPDPHSGHLRMRTYKIGVERRSCEKGCRWGVIGVYDRKDLKHLDLMLFAAIQETH